MRQIAPVSLRLVCCGLVAAAGGALARVAAAPPVAGEDAAVAERVAVVVRADGGERALEGTVIVEAADGAMLLELDDQRLELLQGNEVHSRRTVDAPSTASTPREEGNRILAELPAGFDLLVTRHYVICFDTSRAYAQWSGALFEKLHDAFLNYWRKAGVEVEAPRRPLVVVIFSDRQRYEAHAARDLGAAADRVVGYYNLMSNRVTTFDLTGSDQLARRPATSAARAGLEILASPEAAGLVSTLVHEASHQMAFNCQMHRRLAPVPVWISEGVATFFETPDPGGRGWKRIGGVNRPRLDTFLAGYRAGVLDEIVRGDEPFRASEGAIDAYARAWALTAFLAQTRKGALVEYINVIGAKPPLSPDGPEERLRDFVAAFGVEPHELEQPLMKFLARWKE
ncbi:MAG: DUF1570 domain-containing protein [Planctomycetaceae bacterium]|nr:DUF1570 domain-containing protein [Planctomycetaceae bacterium]